MCPVSQTLIVRDARPSELAEIGDLRVAAYEAGGFLSDASHYGETLRTLGHDGTGQILAAVQEDGGRVGPARGGSSARSCCSCGRTPGTW